MEDFLKKILYTGVGLVALASEKLQTTIDDLVEQGKLSKDDGKQIVDEFLASTSDKRDEMESKLRSVVEEVVSKIQFPSNEDFDKLHKRVEEFESRFRETTEDVLNRFGISSEGIVEELKKRIEVLEDKLGFKKQQADETSADGEPVEEAPKTRAEVEETPPADGE